MRSDKLEQTYQNETVSKCHAILMIVSHHNLTNQIMRNKRFNVWQNLCLLNPTNSALGGFYNVVVVVVVDSFQTVQQSISLQTPWECKEKVQSVFAHLSQCL